MEGIRDRELRIYFHQEIQDPGFEIEVGQEEWLVAKAPHGYRQVTGQGGCAHTALASDKAQGLAHPRLGFGQWPGRGSTAPLDGETDPAREPWGVVLSL